MTTTNLEQAVLTEDELSELLAAEIPTTLEGSSLESSNKAAGARNFKTRQFTLVSLPCLTIYLQGLPASAPPALEDFTFSWALNAGALKLRVLGYPSLPLATKRAIANSFTTLIAADGLFTPAHPTLLTSIIKEHPILIQSAGGLAALTAKALNATEAASTVADWLTQLSLQPTTYHLATDQSTPAEDFDLNTLSLELV